MSSECFRRRRRRRIPAHGKDRYRRAGRVGRQLPAGKMHRRLARERGGGDRRRPASLPAAPPQDSWVAWTPELYAAVLEACHKSPNTTLSPRRRLGGHRCSRPPLQSTATPLPPVGAAPRGDGLCAAVPRRPPRPRPPPHRRPPRRPPPGPVPCLGRGERGGAPRVASASKESLPERVRGPPPVVSPPLPRVRPSVSCHCPVPTAATPVDWWDVWTGACVPPRGRGCIC